MRSVCNEFINHFYDYLHKFRSRVYCGGGNKADDNNKKAAINPSAKTLLLF